MTLEQEIENIIIQRTGVRSGTSYEDSLNAVQQQQIIEIVQQQVGRYYEEDLDSGNDVSFLRPTLRPEAEALGITEDLLAASNEMEIASILKTRHMICVIQSWFCQRQLREYGLQERRTAGRSQSTGTWQPSRPPFKAGTSPACPAEPGYGQPGPDTQSLVLVTALERLGCESPGDGRQRARASCTLIRRAAFRTGCFK
jgi:hypothetical protein